MLPDHVSPGKGNPLKLHHAHDPGRNTFTGYGEGYVMVNGVRHETSVLVMPEGEVTAWPIRDIRDLDEALVARLARLDLEVLLIGTGRRLSFPPQQALLPLVHARIGWEAMDSFAACRTYNILMAEGRKVAAALILEG